MGNQLGDAVVSRGGSQPPSVMGVYCPAIWVLKDKLRSLGLALRPPSPCSPSFLFPSLFHFLPFLSSIYLHIHNIHTHTCTHRHTYNGPILVPLLPILSFQILPSQATHSIHPHKCIRALFCTQNASPLFCSKSCSLT